MRLNLRSLSAWSGVGWPARLDAAWVAYKRRQLNPTQNTSAGPMRRRIYIDVSVIRRHDAGTGIQRVVRAISDLFVAESYPNWEVVLLVVDNKFGYHAIGTNPDDDFSRLTVSPFDIFLGLDFALDDIVRHHKQLMRFKRAGGHLWFFMYDLLPTEHPDWFSRQMTLRFGRWLRYVASLGDGFFCISSPVARSLEGLLRTRYGLEELPRIAVIPMGSDLGVRRYGSGFPHGFARVREAMTSNRSALMVGTVEPRKGHSDVLAAFDKLWASGRKEVLVIVGRPGWKNELVVKRLTTHPMREKFLFWLDNASDEVVEECYRLTFGVVAASYAEGYGLPVLEAIYRHKPVLARNIDVFREHKSPYITLFPGRTSVDELRMELERWFSSTKRQQHFESNQTPTWRDAVNSIIQELETATGQLPLAMHADSDTATQQTQVTIMEQEDAPSIRDQLQAVLIKDGVDFIQAAYLIILGRTADSEGLRFYSNQLDCGINKSAVIRSLLRSKEAAARSVSLPQLRTLVQAQRPRARGIFGRFVTNARLLQQLGQMEDQLDVMLEHVMPKSSANEYSTSSVSPERQLTCTAKPSLAINSHSETVTDLYNNLLKRSPDIGGYKYYIEELAKGTSVGWVAQHIARSEEFKRVLIDESGEAPGRSAMLETIPRSEGETIIREWIDAHAEPDKYLISGTEHSALISIGLIQLKHAARRQAGV